MSKQLTVLFALCYLFFSCDLFTGPKVDLFQQIGDEVDWANAPKLSVRIDYPSVWGTSNPPQGSITPARDIRRGYEFSVEFTPDTAYTLQSWMVFLTSELDGLTDSSSWVENPELIKAENIQPLGSDEVTLPAVNASGGTFTFTILTTEPVTLVPWCDTQPRITRTEPRNRPNDLPYSRASDIVLYFNGALNANTIEFADAENTDGIWITAKSGGIVTTNKENNWFYEPEYAASGGFFTVTMNVSANLPPANSLMTVTVKGIKNAQGDSMDEAGYSFSWNTSSAKDVYFNSWSAEYTHNESTNSGSIKVLYDQTGANNDNVKMYYRLNSGANIDISGGAISGVPGPDVSGVREGRPVSGIREYAVFIELYVDGIMESRASFKIWNIPGMSVAHNSFVKEVRTGAELAAMKDNLGGQYVLADDIAVSGAWIPVGAETTPFTGKFYGNGRTVTINGFAASPDTGLFGVVSGGIVRDLTVVYGNVTVSAAVNVGGIVGQMWSGANILNSIVKGASGTETLTLTPNGGNNANLGGIAGMVLNSFISNCRAGLNVKLNSDGAGSGNIGAVAGFAESGSGGGISINIGYTNPKGKGPNIALANLAIDGVTVTANASGSTSSTGDLNIGGAAGISSNNTMRDIIVSGGGVSFDRTNASGSTIVGGITGYARNTNMEDCSSVGGVIGTINKLNDENTWISLGGLIGNSYVDSGDVYINNCNVRGNIKAGVNLNGNINVGGVLGTSIYKESTVTITNSFFEEGNITAVNTKGAIHAGGFCGSIYEEDYWISGHVKLNSHYTNNCGVMAGTVNIYVEDYGKYITAGGFTSEVIGDISNCFSRANVISRGNGNTYEEGGEVTDYTCYTGGFAGLLATESSITSCYATGTVRSVYYGDRNVGVGGLVGFSLGTIKNCYALGDVLAEKTIGDTFPAHAGGLVGSSSWNGKIQYCFSAGQVIAQSAKTSAFAGGIGGSVDSVDDDEIVGSDITNTAALGGSITVGGPFLSYTPKPENPEDPPGEPIYYLGCQAGRISGSGNRLSNNYANYKMLVGTGEYQKRITAEEVDEDYTGPKTVHGEDITIGSHTVSDTFWRTTLKFDEQKDEDDIPVQSPWDFSTVVGKGYPILKGLAGQ